MATEPSSSARLASGVAAVASNPYVGDSMRVMLGILPFGGSAIAVMDRVLKIRGYGKTIVRVRRQIKILLYKLALLTEYVRVNRAVLDANAAKHTRNRDAKFQLISDLPIQNFLERIRGKNAQDPSIHVPWLLLEIDELFKLVDVDFNRVEVAKIDDEVCSNYAAAGRDVYRLALGFGETGTETA